MRYITQAFSHWSATRHCVAVGLLAVVAASLVGCSPKERIKIEKEFVPVPTIVATGCIATTGRPTPPAPLSTTIPADEWAKRAPGAKAQAVKAQAGERLNYEDQDRAATSGCK